MDELARRYRDGQVDWLDGVTAGFKDWWFNCRPSNTEPLLRLTVEAKTPKLLEEKLTEIRSILGPPIQDEHEKSEPVKEQPEKKPVKKKKTSRKQG